MEAVYKVLARKYRPSTILELKGQEVLVTTLQNAFNLNRIPHAFILTGVRGVGKTTTARIIAKALNCTGEDGKGDITLNPCGKCDNCIAISEDKHLDVLEMDAASKTGIDDIREIIDNVKYKPVSARYKVYIIDEVHMLSKSAFNALLKTLEEPPSHVKFIFATTEIKKVPITVISRCQKFDLRRLSTTELQEHLASICKKEEINFEDNALRLIAKAADGSVRDSLSILDQAIANSGGNIKENKIIEMLGHNNTEDLYNLLDLILNADASSAVNILNKMYNQGFELVNVFEDLLEICHFITLNKTIPEAAKELPSTEFEKTTANNIANKISLQHLIILWQVLIKGIEEIKQSSFPKKTAEMLIIRIIWANSVPNIPELKKILANSSNNSSKNTLPVEENNYTKPLTSNTINTNNIETKNHTDSSSDLIKDIKELFPDAESIDE